MDEEKDLAMPGGVEVHTETAVPAERQHQDCTAANTRPASLSGHRLFVILVLTAALLVSGAYCVHLLGQLYSLKAYYRGAVSEAAEAFNAAEEEYAESIPSSEASAERRRQVKEEMIAQAENEIGRLEQHLAELNDEIRDAEAKADALAASEEHTYYRAIYDEYTEGRAYVEELLSKP